VQRGPRMERFIEREATCWDPKPTALILVAILADGLRDTVLAREMSSSTPDTSLTWRFATARNQTHRQIFCRAAGPRC